MTTHSRLLMSIAVAAVAVVGAFQTASNAQVLVRPKISKNQQIIPVANLVITDLFEGDTPTSVYVQVGNVGTGNAGGFYVKLSLKKKGSATKTYIEKFVGGVKAKTDLPLYIDVGHQIAGLEIIGIFVDSRNQIRELDETNCGKIFPGGASGGYMSCNDF